MTRFDAPPRLSLGVIGTGRVGSVLGAALARAGHHVLAASAVSDASLARARRLLPDARIDTPAEVAAAADLVLLAVPDDELPALVAGLAHTGAFRVGQLVAHTSGAHGLAVLEPATSAGVVPLALHPAMTFLGRPEDLDRLGGAVFGVTASPEFRPVAEALVLEMGGEPVWVPDAARPLYHAALSHGANHVVTVVGDAVQMLREAGVEEPTRLLTPLVGAALDNVLRLGDAALTGPVSRGDTATIAAHLAALSRESPDVVDVYVALARRTAERASASGRISAAQFAALTEVLSRWETR